jgi:hypothetical protein
VWYWPAIPFTDGGSNDLVRVWRGSGGELHERHLIDFIDTKNPVHVVGDASMMTLVAAVCPAGLCGLGVSAGPDNDANHAIVVSHAQNPGSDTNQVLYRSTDGGITWSNYGTLPPGAQMNGITGDQILVTRPPVSARHFYLYPTMEAVSSPSNITDPYPIVSDGAVEWVSNASHGPIYDSDGDLLFSPVMDAFPNASFVGALPNGDGRSFFTWMETKAKSPKGYIALMGADGQARAVYGEDANLGHTYWAAPLSEAQIIGTVLKVDPTSRDGAFGLALFDLQSGSVHPIDGLTQPDGGELTPFLSTVTTGSFAMVNTGGDCLNVRAEASTNSKSLGCFADGVLLHLRDQEAEGDSQAWLSVTTPSGAEGWASAEFLIR